MPHHLLVVKKIAKLRQFCCSFNCLEPRHSPHIRDCVSGTRNPHIVHKLQRTASDILCDVLVAAVSLVVQGVMVVEEAAAKQGMHSAVAAPYNHTDICRPQTPHDMCYTMLVTYIKDSLEVPKV